MLIDDSAVVDNVYDDELMRPQTAVDGVFGSSSKSDTGLIVGLIILFIVLIAGGVAAFYLLRKRDALHLARGGAE